MNQADKISGAAVLSIILGLAIGVVLLAWIAACGSSFHGWTRADLPADVSMQRLLDFDRGECEEVERARPILWQILFSAGEIERCLERKGWEKVHESD